MIDDVIRRDTYGKGLGYMQKFINMNAYNIYTYMQSKYFGTYVDNIFKKSKNDLDGLGIYKTSEMMSFSLSAIIYHLLIAN